MSSLFERYIMLRRDDRNIKHSERFLPYDTETIYRNYVKYQSSEKLQRYIQKYCTEMLKLNIVCCEKISCENSKFIQKLENFKVPSKQSETIYQESTKISS